MTKITFVGGGSVQWTLKLAIDLLLEKSLAGAELVLHDIDKEALDLLARACRRAAAQAGGNLQITASTDRVVSLRDADFVVLCVAIGGLEAMRYDLAIPRRYDVCQSVGDTVGPGGLARALRHIPFAVQVAREMQDLCPEAWLLNLTNPMTTICRSVTRVTDVRTIGICHEVSIFARGRLARLLGVPAEAVSFDIAGINHLPVILRLRANGVDAFPLLRNWLTQHGPFEFIAERIPGVRNVFHDRLAVKLSLFGKLGVLFGAGDRHVAEFLPGFLTRASGRGKRYGVILTTIAHRQKLARQRLAATERFVAGGRLELIHSGEQLSPIMAALAGGPAGRFIVNVPNLGQIENLPRDAVVECKADIDSSGLRPVSAGALPHAAHATVASHVDRQELVVEAALAGRYDAALAALASDPLVGNPEVAEQMLDELLTANDCFMRPAFLGDGVRYRALR